MPFAPDPVFPGWLWRRTVVSQEWLAEEAVEVLWIPEHGMFRSHPGEDRCDAVDAPGLLLLALLQLESEQRLELFGMRL